MKRIYLDHCATTAASEAVAKKVYEALTQGYGNPSSLHGVGAEAYRAIGMARHQIAKVLAAPTSAVYFTSGGTESNNLALFGAAYGNRSVGSEIVTTAIEHSSILNTAAQLEREGFTVKRIFPRKEDGCIHAEDILEAVTEKTALVTMMFVNNETGELLPIREVISGVRKKNPQTLIHCDCVQGFGKLPFRLFEYDVDLLSASAHKLHGPKGVGCLYLKDRSRYMPRLFGGGQESGIKPGTENVPSIVGFGEACDQALLHVHQNLEHAARLKDFLLKGLKELGYIRINSPDRASPYIVNFSLLGCESHEVVSYMSSRGIYISAGSACSKGTPSHVLQAMGKGGQELAGAIRVSFSETNTIEELEDFLTEIKRCLK